MPLITRQNLDLNQLRYYVDWRDQEKGKALYDMEQASVTDFTGESAGFEVAEKKQTYRVLIQTSGQTINFGCSCQADNPKPRFCHHIIAAAYTLRDYLKKVAEKDWRYQLELTLQNAPPPQKATAQKKKAFAPGIILIGLETSKQNQSPFYTGTLRPYFISAEKWGEIQKITESQDPAQAALDLLTTRSDWSSFTQNYLRGAPIQSVNLSVEGRELIDMAVSSSYDYNEYLRTAHYYSSYYGLASISFARLPLLAHLKVPILLHKEGKFSVPVHVHAEALELQAVLTESKNDYEMVAGLQVGGQAYTLAGRKLQIFSETSPLWALAGETLVEIANPESLAVLSTFPLKIQRSEADDFRSLYFGRLSKYLPVVGETVKWQIVQEPAIPRLYLAKKEEQPLVAELRFGYGEHELASPGTRPVFEELIEIPGQWGGIKVQRDAVREHQFYDLLTDARYGLKRAGANQPGVFQIRARTHPLDFLTKCIPALTETGFEIYGDKDIAKINRHKPTLSLNISSGIDWFDVQAVAQYGDQQVSLGEIRKAFKRGERYIKLADGSVGQIPEEWLEKYKHLFALAEETDKGLRVSDLQLSLLDELLSEAETKNIAPEFHAKRERLKSFERITEQPLPQGFGGELRPYQKAGYDWLHFLREYGFGGILADDMGLGKTVQALVFLQSLKERGELSRPALLVLPKSLLVNWQREAERFTPDLRVLQFMGQTRKKEPAHFEEYDIITTTYGTMLRDIEFLREYRFTYVILDESQAIKNPLAQSSKAARLLQAEHRLCLTGTPIENNVYELWSQFAFLNPGLLGSLDYFKRGFASAIERREEAAQPTTHLLRQMIYPFILRRTKEQVAPELPPRTERIIYTDMEPAQRKLYQQTREYYRSLLMGMLAESGDINDIRFKILEGLLRMRQVCIHPRLVEPTYRGPSAKFEVLLETLETLQSEGHKALVFSQFIQTLSLLREEMDARGMTYTYLDGQTQNRQEQVDSFQNEPKISFFLISLKAGGVGLNLTAADYVLHIDPWWNPAVEMQASDRAHRIGQDKPVFVYKFIARETVEEKILQLQERKRELVEQLISAEGSFFKSLTKDDVQALFS
ncbi:MAG: SNF2-related protein [Anaerolineales bacterium]|jgi:non-specific serine/threonine protein kinase|nr:SNF2-related protein [Anaerolineales bacterium]